MENTSLEGGTSTICNSWKCGAPENSACLASFIASGKIVNDTAISPHCRLCYSDRLGFLRVPTLPVPGTPDTDLVDSDPDVRSSESPSSDTCPSMESGADDDESGFGENFGNNMEEVLSVVVSPDGGLNGMEESGEEECGGSVTGGGSVTDDGEQW